MERTPVSSSSIASIGYEAESRILEIEFPRGAVFRYYDVPTEEHEAFMASDSKGRYFNSNIKNRYQHSQE